MFICLDKECVSCLQMFEVTLRDQYDKCRLVLKILKKNLHTCKMPMYRSC